MASQNISWKISELPCDSFRRLVHVYLNGRKRQALSGIIGGCSNYNIVLFYDRLTELLEACQTGNLDIVRQICMVKKHVNAASKQGWHLIAFSYPESPE